MTRTTAHTNNGRANHGRHTRHPLREQTRSEQRRILSDRYPKITGNPECKFCEKRFAPASLVIMDEWKHTESGGGSIVRVGLFCDHCNVLRMSILQIDSNGRAVSILEDRQTSNQREIDQFLKLYPEARGIVE